MFDFYSMTKRPTAAREAARAMRDHAGNLPAPPAI
jgi:hypothetical protein